MVRFLDSSVFLHAYLRPSRALTQQERAVKQSAAEIIGRVEKGEKVVTSVVHLAETLNIVEARLGVQEALKFLENILTLGNLEIEGVTREGLEAAMAIASRFSVSANDALAFLTARRVGAEGIYSFNRHFDNLPDLERISK